MLYAQSVGVNAHHSLRILFLESVDHLANAEGLADARHAGYI
jgi:hypothetical protein